MANSVVGVLPRERIDCVLEAVDFFFLLGLGRGAYNFSLMALFAACTARLCAFLGVSGRARSLTCCLVSLRMVRKWDSIGLC